MRAIIKIGLVLGLVPVILYAGMTLGYRMDMVPLGTIFSSFQWLVPLLFVGGAVMLLAAVVSFISSRGATGVVAILGALVAVAMAMGPIQMRKTGGEVPPIHDITTDTENPPEFIITAAERTEGENPAAYDREQTAPQLEAYPDLVSIIVAASPETAFDACLAAAKSAGFRLADQDREAGRLEATATSRWFGFKDDVVFRVLSGENGGSIIDIRSKSRVGRSDLGANAERIRMLRERILDTLGETA